MKRNIYLRVKLKSLASEAKHIRLEEHKAKDAKEFFELQALREHRIHKVRTTGRATLLAYQFLRGVPYAVCEQEDSRPFDITPVLTMIQKYGDRSFTLKSLTDWLAGKTAKEEEQQTA